MLFPVQYHYQPQDAREIAHQVISPLSTVYSTRLSMIWSILCNTYSSNQCFTLAKGRYARREPGLASAEVERQPAGNEDVHHGRDTETQREYPLFACTSDREHRQEKEQGARLLWR